jgi:hypothetical protein
MVPRSRAPPPEVLLPDPAVMPAPVLVALGHLARMGLEYCPAELRGRTAALMRGELDEPAMRQTVNDLGLMAGAVTGGR